MPVRVEIRKDLGSFRLEAAFEAGDWVHGILGASGCGKSMTLKCVAGVVRPDEGFIQVGDRVLFDSAAGIDLPPQRRRVGLLFQNYALFPNMTVEQNLMAALRGEKDKGAARRRCRDMLRRLELEGLEDRRPGQLSGGQQQRAALGRILVTRPDLLMLDEPFSALDSYLRWQTRLELGRVLEDFSGPTLLVSHSREEVGGLCRTVSVLDRGRSQPPQGVEELFRQPGTLAAGLLSGCENFSRARPTGERTLLALDWQARLSLPGPVPEDLAYVGVRSRFLTLAQGPGENCFPARLERVLEDPFSAVALLVVPGGEGRFGRLRLEVPKEERAALEGREELWLHVEPEHIMPLR